MPKPPVNRKITMELLPEEKPGSPQRAKSARREKRQGPENGGNGDTYPPAPSLNFNFSALFSGMESKYLENLGSLALPGQPTALELATAKTLRDCFGPLPSIEGPLYSLKSLDKIQSDLLGGANEGQAIGDVKPFIMVECSKDMSSMEVVCGPHGQPTIVELPAAVGNISFPLPNSPADLELRYVPLKGGGSVPASSLSGKIPSFESEDKYQTKGTQVKGKNRAEKKAMPSSGRTKGDHMRSDAAKALSLQSIRRFKDGLSLDKETESVIKMTLKPTSNVGRKRGRTGDVPDGWDEPSDEEILANLLLIDENMKGWEAACLKKEVRRVRNRFSAELSRLRKKGFTNT